MQKVTTAAYTILKNEINNIEKWMHYTQYYDYRVLLDTGSTDGSWELLQQYRKKDKNLIIEQKEFTPWRFDVARKHNLSMIPYKVHWALSPDLDEYFSINSIDYINYVVNNDKTVSCISCDRLDLYSRDLRVGPPKFLPSNKIHRLGDYTWTQPIYEHLKWIHKDMFEYELYCPEIYLIHDQDFKKQDRPELYFKMLKEEYETNPKNTWCLWYYLVMLYKNRNIEDYIPAASDFVRYEKDKESDKFNIVKNDLLDIFKNKKDLTYKQRITIIEALNINE